MSSKVSMRSPWRRPLGVLAYGLVLVYAALLVIPVYFVVVSAFKDNQAIFGSPLALPSALSLANFARAQEGADLGRALLNSVTLTVSAELLTLALAIPASYALARAGGRVADAMDRLFSLGFLVPAFAVLVPTLLLAVAAGLFRSTFFLILFYPATALPLTIVLLTQFMRSIPIELAESATVDGATELGILRRIWIPLIMPGVAAVVILNFLNFWNEYIFALVILGPDSRTVQVAVPTLRTGLVIEYGLLSAGILISVLPVYVAYVFLQRRMQDALTAGAVKG
jgi:multiple sugar transport system permease protein